ncbi:MAG: MBL fold metallo-hydrolase [Vicinamibacterales bacterium]
MKRIIALGVLVGVGALSLAVTAAQQPAAQNAPKVVDVEKLKDNLYVLRGAGSGGNTAVFITGSGVIVVDTKNPGWGQPLLAKIRELTDKPVTTIINTHSHHDHVSGNVDFPASVDFVAHENTKPNMEAMKQYTGQTAPPPNVFKDSGGRGIPKRTFKDHLTLGAGADRVELHYYGRGHTNGDAFVVFPSARAMHAGDIFSGKNIPYLDLATGGSGVAIADTLQKAHDSIRDVDTIITGHSTQMTWADLREYIAFNREFLNDVKTARQAGKSVDEIAAAWTIPAKYAGYAAPQPNRLKANIQVVFDELTSGTR